jgi:hypothetical protein
LNADQKLLVKQLKLDLPSQPPPRITAAATTLRPQPTSCFFSLSRESWAKKAL